ncbi:MAG TPA: hypothetical protein VH575_34055 [Gemmataceae bacterium]|jgi:hypothetical protein
MKTKACLLASVLHVREGGRWLMALLREWPDPESSPSEIEGVTPYREGF